MSGRMLRLVGVVAVFSAALQIHACAEPRSDTEPHGDRSRVASRAAPSEPFALVQRGDVISTTAEAHPLRLRFDARGASAARAMDGISVTLSVSRVARSDSRPVVFERGAPKTSGHRVEYRGANATEWYEVKAEGLEQGLTLARRPGGTGPVEVDVDLDETFEAIPSGIDGTLNLRRRGDQAPSFRYGALAIEDTDGRSLESSLSARPDGGIRISFDDTAATYPVIVDPLVWAFRTKLTKLVAKPQDIFGAGVAIDGDHVAVSMHGRDGFSGGVVFFVHDDNGWNEESVFGKPDAALSNDFGLYPIIRGSRAIAGSDHTVAAFVRANGSWTLEQTLTPPVTAPIRPFGAPTAMSGDRIAVAVPKTGATILEDGGISGETDLGPGAVFIYDRDPSGWKQSARIDIPYVINPNLEMVVALEGDVLVIGTGIELFIHRRSADGAWPIEAVLPAPPGAPFEGFFGIHVAIAGSTVLATNTPWVEVFELDGAAWVYRQRVTPPSVFGGSYGDSLAVAGDVAFVGSNLRNGNIGAAFRLRRAGGLWTLEEEISPDDATPGSLFGNAMATTPTRAVFGAPGQGSLEGAAYVYELSRSLGEPCDRDNDCASNHCVDGVCCDTACGGGAPGDCVSCNGDLTRGTCSPVAAAVVCRPAQGECDAPEACDGRAPTCPADQSRENGAVCNAGVCISGACVARPPRASNEDAGFSLAPSTSVRAGCDASGAHDARDAWSTLGAVVAFAMFARRRRGSARFAATTLALSSLSTHAVEARGVELGSAGQQLSVRLDVARTTWIDDASGASSVLTLASFGRAGALQRVPDVSPVRIGKRAIYDRGALVEWYVATDEGIEQGFDVENRPEGSGRLSLYLRGRPLIGADGTIRFGRLFAFDHRGRALPVTSRVDATGLSIEVDDSDAEYPIVIDPSVWRERQILTGAPSSIITTTEFGRSLVIEGHRAFVGSPGSSKAVRVFHRVGATWTFEAELAPDEDLYPFSGFGGAIAVDATLAAVGAPGHADFSGRVFVFEQSGSQWLQSAVLFPPPSPDPGARPVFGFDVALHGDTLVVGSPAGAIPADRGSVEIFTRVDGTWVPTGRIDAPPDADSFGGRVALSGDALAVTAARCSVSEFFIDSHVYFYRRSGTEWLPDGEVFDTDGTRIGCGLDLSGDTAVLGGPSPWKVPTVDPFVDVYRRISGVWDKTQRLRPAGGTFGTFFGRHVRLRGDRLFVGAPGANAGRGAGFLFEENGTAWIERARFASSDATTDDNFGFSSDLDGDVLLVGAHRHFKGDGAVYSFFSGLQGDACTTGDVCASGFCVDGVCCDSECGGSSATDCQACSVATGGTTDGVCGLARGPVCRPARDECDVAELCDGSGLTCPADVTVANGARCDDSRGVCAAGSCQTIEPLTSNAANATRETSASTVGSCACTMHATSSTVANNLGAAISVLAIAIATRRRRRGAAS